MQNGMPIRATKRAFGSGWAVRLSAVVGALVGIAGCSSVQTDSRADSQAGSREGVNVSPDVDALVRGQTLDERGGFGPLVSIEAVREQVGYGVLPDDVRARVDRKIEKKLLGGPTSHGSDAIDFFLMQRVQEGEEYPVNRVKEITKREMEKAEAQIAQASLRRGYDLGSSGVIDGWQPIGPGNVGGRTRAMLISPNGPGTGSKSDTGFMLAAGVSGGVFKSTDGGESWRPVSDLLDNIAISTLAMDPTNPQIIYAGTGEGFGNLGAVRGLGIFKSEDAGESWRQLEETLAPSVPEIAFHYVNKIAISPADPKKLYAATRTGVWIHENAGEPENIDGEKFQWDLKLANPFFLTGASRSNGSSVGATDLQIRPPTSTGVADPLDEEVVIAAFGGFRSDGLWITGDGGGSWFQAIDESASAGEIHKIDSEAQGRMTIAFGPRNGPDSGKVYVLMARNQFFPPRDEPDSDGFPNEALDIPFGAVVNLFRADMAELEITQDDENNITSISLPFEARLAIDPSDNPLNRLLLSNAIISGVCGSGEIVPSSNQGWYDNIIKVDPSDENVVWAGGIDLYRSDDAGENFGLASYWYFDSQEDAYVHADQHEIVFHPDYDGSINRTMYVTNDGGIYRTEDALAMTASTGCPFPDGKTGIEIESELVFENLNNGYGVTQFYHGATGTTAGGRDLYVGGTQDNGTVRSLRRECTEGWQELLGGDGGYVAVDPNNSNLIYAETQNFGRIFRVVNTPGFGEGPSNISEGLRDRDIGLFITPFAMDPSNPGTLWTGGLRPWKTENADAGNRLFVNWRPGPNFNVPGIPAQFDLVSRVSAIAIAPSDPDIVYMGFEDGWIARTENGTATDPDWIVISNGLPIETGFISSIAIDPQDPNVVWITNSRFTELSDDANVYRGAPIGDNGDDPNAWIFAPMDGTDCNLDDEIDLRLPGLPAHWISIRDCDAGGRLIFIGTEIGVYVSDDAYEIDEDCDPIGDGSQLFDKVTWNNINLGGTGNLPSTIVESLAFRDDNTIVAFTYGRGAFLANINDVCGDSSTSKPCGPADLVAPFGILDSADLLAFTQDFQAGRLSADIPLSGETCGDGLLDGGDLARFIDLFNQPCP